MDFFFFFNNVEFPLGPKNREMSPVEEKGQTCKRERKCDSCKKNKKSCFVFFKGSTKPSKIYWSSPLMVTNYHSDTSSCLTLKLHRNPNQNGGGGSIATY